MNKTLISEKILHIRNLHNMSREELAEKAELSVSYLYQLESGRKSIGLSALIKVSDVLQVSIDELVDGNRKEPESNKYYIMLNSIISDCTAHEAAIIIENARQLKQTLMKYRY